MNETIKNYKEAKTVLMTVSPFIASLLSKARVVITEEIPTAAVDEKNNIGINPRFFNSLTPEERVFVLAHEAMHWAFLDTLRVNNRDKKIWNIAADAVNNEALLQVMKPGRLKEGMWTIKRVSDILLQLRVKVPKDIHSMPKEELYDLLRKYTDGCNIPVKLKGVQAGDGNVTVEVEDLTSGELKGQVVQEGSPEIYGSKDYREFENAIKRAIAEAEQMQKSRGKMPAGLQRLVDEILRPKVPWKTLLRQYLKEGFGKVSTQSWKKLSRRHRDYPGKKRLTNPRVWVGIDTSGSIEPEEIKQFLGEVMEIARANRGHVTVIPWDAKMYDPIELRSASQISKVVSGLRGGYGTDPTEFMEYVVKKMKPFDLVVILSDGYIGDPKYYRELAVDITRKASMAVFVSTGMEVRWPRWKFIKLE